MYKGFVKTFGKKAIAIEDDKKKQYYALLNEVDILVTEHLNYPLLILPVKFNVNVNKHSGRTNIGLRYYATNVELDVEF